MNKKLLTYLLFVPLLAGCTPKVEYVVDENGIKLEVDQAEDYIIDESVTNENGSMSYEVFVRSFYDSDGNGIGDFKGLEAKLPYFKDLGIKTLWLMPIMPSPTYHGYDITNYYDVHRDFGTLQDFKDLVNKAHEHNIDIMLDMVLNHCSVMNPYFSQSYLDYVGGNTSPDSKADWFNWGPGGGAYYQGEMYECRFDSTMPDFNFDCQAVRDEIDNIFKFWIEGCNVDGFRLDAVLYYYYQNTSKNIEVMNFLVDTAKKYDEDFYMVGECWQSDAILNSYTASKLDSFFRFDQASGGQLSLINMIKGFGRANNYAKTIEANETACKNKNSNYYSSYFLSNHDQDRISKNFDETTNKAAASLLCLLPGTPYMYYGEEIQLKGRRNTTPDDFSDVRRRLPMIWSKNDKTGECKFPESNRLDLSYNDQVEDGVEDKLQENFSLLKHYRKVINVRNKYPFMKNGKFKNMTPDLQTSETGVMAYKISLGDEYVIIVHNFMPYAVEVTSPGNEIVDEINTSHLKPKLEEGKLSIAAQSTVLLK